MSDTDRPIAYVKREILDVASRPMDPRAVVLVLTANEAADLLLDVEHNVFLDPTAEYKFHKSSAYDVLLRAREFEWTVELGRREVLDLLPFLEVLPAPETCA